MSEWIDATNNPQEFVQAVKLGKKVFADFNGDVSLCWNGGQLIYEYPSKFAGEYEASVFPAFFKRSDKEMKPIFDFYDAIKKENEENEDA